MNGIRIWLTRTVGALVAAAIVVVGLPLSASAAPNQQTSIDDVTVNEGSASITFTISYTGIKAAFTVDWATADDTAVAGADYTASSGTATLPNSNARSTTITVPVLGDPMDEANETFFVNLSNPSKGTILDGQGLGTITDDALVPSLSVNDVSAMEGDAGISTMTFTVSLDTASGKTITVDWATADGTAMSGSDYTAATGSRTFTSGQTSKTFGVSITGDTLDESDETLTVTLSNPSNAALADASGLGTITDDDPEATLSIDDVSMAEGNAGISTMTFTVSLDTASGKTVTVDWATADGTATSGSDYGSASGSLTLTPGQTSKTAGVSIAGDVVYEQDETFTVDLSNAVNAVVGDGSGTGTITNDDAAPSFSIDDVSVIEGNAGTVTATFTVTKTGSTDLPSSVDWATSDGTATILDSDYLAGSGTLNFAPGDTTKTLDVLAVGDVTLETNEVFHVDLSNPSGATIADAQGDGTISDDDSPPTLAIDDVAVTEGNAGTVTATFTVTKSGSTALPSSVDWATSDGTATLLDADYLVGFGTLNFAPGDTTQTLDVLIVGDAVHEDDEVFHVDLSNASGATISDPQGNGTISDDDTLPTLSIGNVTVTEGNTGTVTATFPVSLVGSTALPVMVDWATSDGTATTAGSDYAADSGTLTFIPGDASETVGVVVTGDKAWEGNETFQVDLSNVAEGIIADGLGDGTISNDDKRPTVLTLKVKKTLELVKATGTLAGGILSGAKVKVTLLKKKGAKYVRVASKLVKVKKIVAGTGTYLAKFPRPKAGRYKFLAAYAGDLTHLKSQLSKLTRI